MSWKGSESWDIYGGIVTNVTDYWQGYDASGSSSLQSGLGRCSSVAFKNTTATGNGPFIGVTTSSSGGYMGVAYSPTTLAQSLDFFTIENSSAGVLAFLHVTSAGAVEAWKGPNTILGTLLGTTATGLISAGHYAHIGCEWKLHASAGYMKVWVNGSINQTTDVQSTPDYSSGSTDTTNIWTSGQWDLLYWHPQGLIDDLYWGDSAGAAPHNGYIGDQRIQGQLAMTDAAGGGGSDQDFTPSTGTDHGALLDEDPANDGTDYVASSTIGHKETVIFPSIALVSGRVYGVQMMPNLVKSAAGGRQIVNLLRNHLGAEAQGDETWGPSETDYKFYPEPFQTNPTTGDTQWTASEVNAMEGGIEIVG